MIYILPTMHGSPKTFKRANMFTCTLVGAVLIPVKTRRNPLSSSQILSKLEGVCRHHRSIEKSNIFSHFSTKHVMCSEHDNGGPGLNGFLNFVKVN